MKILLAGDSTVTEQPRSTPNAPGTSYCGWGQMLPLFLAEQTAVLNFAVSGYTAEMFRQGEPYTKLCAQLQPRDYVLIQFGHNDQKLSHLRADGGYTQELEGLAKDVAEQGGAPVLVTPVARNSWRGDTGEYNDLLAPYAEAVIALGRKMNIPVLDLHGVTVGWVQALGLEGAKRYFHPGDYTHPNDYGGGHWAECVARLIRDDHGAGLQALRAALLPRGQWPSMAYALDKERLVCGWTAPPQPRTDFAQWRDASPLSYAQALEMAQQGYGYFVSVDTEQPYPLAALAAAKENGYLPPNFPRDKTALEQPITGGAFAELMKLACKGRNRLTPETLAAKALGGTLSGEEAAAYALALEQAATGCTCQANPKQAATGCTRQASPKQAAPAGS